MSEYKLNGWRHDIEDRISLHAGCKSTFLLRQYRGAELPAVVDPRDWLHVEDQGQIGSCQGNALSTAGEFAHKIATGDGKMQFSRHWCYIMSQRMDGIKGDNGSTLTGGQKVAHEYGFALESTVPYPSSYTSKIPNEEKAKEEAKAFKIKTSLQCHTFDDIREFIGHGFGGVQIGIAWPDSWMNYTGGLINDFNPGNGGHSVIYVGYLADDELLGMNSWGLRWGMKGYFRVSRRSVEKQLAHNWTEMIGHTDMDSPKPRRIKVLC